MRTGFARDSGLALFERGGRALIALGTGVALARLLGPDSYGALAATLAWYSILSVAGGLGIAGTLVQSVAGGQPLERLLAGVILLRFGACAVAASLLWLGVQLSLLPPGGASIAIVLGLAVFPLEALDHWLQGRNRFAALAGLRLSAAALSSAGMLTLTLLGSSLAWIVAAKLSEWLLLTMLALGTGVVGFRELFQPSRAAILAAWRLAKRSTPLAVSALAASINLRIDQAMLAALHSTAEAAQYAVAVQVSEAWYLVATAIAAALMPRLIQMRSREPSAYHASLQSASDSLVWLALAGAAAIYAAAPALVELLYGADYARAATTLSIHAWAAVFVFHRALVSKWIIIEDLIMISVITQIAGASLNVVLNAVLIPAYGAPGAAVATLGSYAISGYAGLRLYPRAAPAARMFERSLLWPVRRAMRTDARA